MTLGRELSKAMFLMIIRCIDCHPNTYPQSENPLQKQDLFEKKRLGQTPVNCPETKITVSTFILNIFWKTLSNQMIESALEPPRCALSNARRIIFLVDVEKILSMFLSQGVL